MKKPSLAELIEILENRRSEIKELKKQRELVSKELDKIDNAIAKLEGKPKQRKSGRPGRKPGRPKGTEKAKPQEEAMKRGLYTTAAGGQVCVIPNHLNAGHTPLNYRTGSVTRRILALDWILPDGEMVKLGSAAIQNDYFWGEGPVSPDIKCP